MTRTPSAAGAAAPLFFERIALLGIGLIGSSLAHVVRRHGLAGHIAVAARTHATLDKAMELGIADSTTTDARQVVEGAELVVICAPLGAYRELAAAMAPGLKEGAIVTDVGSAKQCVIDDVAPYLPAGVHFVPAHPVAGTEYSGPEAGFAELFEGRYCIVTPEENADPAAVATVIALWEQAGMRVERMSARYHDQVLALTSHLPHLIAYTIVGTATDLSEQLELEVVKYSAGGFRDFTRIAASDPIMWRDIFLKNREAVLEMLGRFTEDLTALQRAIRWDEGEALRQYFTRTRDIRRRIVAAKQA